MRASYFPVIAAIAMAAPASAGQIRPFDRATFQALETRNASTVVFVHASWCPICRAQETTIKRLLVTPAYRNVTVLTIDYDTQKPFWTSFGAQKQSTLIGFHGRRESARLAYDADPQKVTALVASTLR